MKKVIVIIAAIIVIWWVVGWNQCHNTFDSLMNLPGQDYVRFTYECQGDIGIGEHNWIKLKK